MTGAEPRGRSEEAVRAASGSVRLLGMQVVARLSGAAFALVGTRVLAPEELGRYSAAVATYLLFASLADLGAAPAVARLVSRAERSAEQVLSGLIPVALLLGAVVGVLAVAFARVALGAGGAGDVAVVAVGLPLQAVASCAYGALDGVNRVDARARIATLVPLVQFGLGLVVLVVTGSVRATLIAVPLGAAVGAVGAAASLRRLRVWSMRLGVSGAVVGEVLRTAWPFALLAAISSIAARLDVILLSSWVGSEAAAIYDVAARMVEASGLVLAAVAPPTLVILNRRRAAGDHDGAQRAVDAASRLLQLGGLGLTVVLVGSAQAIVGLLGSGYDEAVVPLRVLGAQVWLSFTAGLLGTILLSGERLARVVPVAACITALTISLDVVLIPRYGVGGAAWASVAGSVIAVIVFSSAATRWGEPVPSVPPPVLVGATGVATAVAWAFDARSLGWVGALVGVSLLAAAAIATGAVGRADLRWMRAS